MKATELDKKYGLYKSIDLVKDSRINVFCKAGGGFIFFALLAVGFFVDNQNFLFPFQKGIILYIQYLSLVLSFVLYIFLHEGIHLLTAKILKMNARMSFDSLLPFTTFEGSVNEKKKYQIAILSPVIILTIILIPIIIIVRIKFDAWFWIPWFMLMQNLATSMGDVVAFFYTKKYKDCYIEDDDSKILVYIPIKDFAKYKQDESAYYEKKYLKKQKKKKRKEQFLNAPKLGKQKYEQSLKEHNSSDNSDIDDLNKLDM